MGDHRITRGIEVALLIGPPDPRVFQAMIDFTEAFIESVSLSSLPLRLWRRALAASNHLVQALFMYIARGAASKSWWCNSRKNMSENRGSNRSEEKIYS